MKEPIRAAFGSPFRAQVAALQLRLANQVPTARWDDLRGDQHARAFAVAGALKADLLADIGEAVRKTQEEGGTLETFTKDFRKIVVDHGWHGWTGEGTAKGEAWRIRTIYRTNAATSFAAGRMAQLVDGNYRWWVYRHGNALEPRLQHLAWDGIALKPDHPFWATHAPPNGWGCTCRVVGADTEAGIRRVGGDPGKVLPPGWDAIDPRTGAPSGIDKGWAYPVGRSVALDVAQEVAGIAARTAARVPPATGTDLIAANRAAIDKAWTGWVDRQLEAGTKGAPGLPGEPGLLGALSHDVVAALAARGIEPASSEIMVRPGLVAGVKAAGPARAGDALSGAEWRALPLRLRTPDAVLRDERTGRLIYVLPSDGGPEEKLALTLDTRTRADSQATFANMVVAAARQPRPGLLSRLVGGLVSLILGSLD